jgi:hypothetical protein
MKTKLLYMIALPLAIALAGCRKNSDLQPVSKMSENQSLMNLATTAVALNTVTTIAGGSLGYQDGTGANAKFSTPYGIQYAADGNIYVADRYNDKLRKVTPQGAVTTLPVTKPGNPLLDEPEYVAVSKTGIINVICISNEGFSENRIYKPDGTFDFAIAPFYAIFGTLAKDPYGDFFWSAQNGLPVKFLITPDRGWIGTDAPNFTNEYLEYPESEERHRNCSALAVGYNKVMYFAYGGHLYKHLLNGYTERIFKNLDLGGITSIILNKDSRTIYLAAYGYIKRIDDGKLTVIAGPDGSNTGRDGAGRKADVYAQSLAMGKTENEIYFSDIRVHAIRKIAFK